MTRYTNIIDDFAQKRRQQQDDDGGKTWGYELRSMQAQLKILLKSILIVFKIQMIFQSFSTHLPQFLDTFLWDVLLHDPNHQLQKCR